MSIAPPPHQGDEVDLPIAQSVVLQPGAIREDAIRITVSRDGRLFFDAFETGPEGLSNLIRMALREGAQKKVYLRADAKTKNIDVELVIDQIRLAGVRDVVILANKPAPLSSAISKAP